MKPYLRELPTFSLSDYPQSTAYEAGHLVTKNAGWRSVRPVISESRCTGCLQCYLHCPDGTVFLKDQIVGIDYDFCKGCGICKTTCKAGAIEMEAENK